MFIEFDYAIALRVAHRVGKDERAFGQAGGAFQDADQPLTIENVIAQNQAGRFAADELRAHPERIRQAARLVLLGVGEFHAPLRPIAQQALENRQVFGCADDQHFPYPGQH